MSNLRFLQGTPINRLLYVLLVVLLLNACTKDSEQSITFYDELLEQEVVTVLVKDDIPFRRDGNTIWYSIDHREAVQEIFDKAVSSRPVQYKFYDKEKQEKFVTLLGNNGIVVVVSESDAATYVVSVPNEDRKKSEEIFRQVITE
ncbi:MAG: hypothetical protein ACE5FQ_14545 [Thiogranum sp.]